MSMSTVLLFVHNVGWNWPHFPTAASVRMLTPAPSPRSPTPTRCATCAVLARPCQDTASAPMW